MAFFDMFPDGTFDGRFPEVVAAEPPDVRFGLEFSHRPDTLPVGVPNIHIAERLELAHHEYALPVFASRSIVRALAHIGAEVPVLEVFAGPSAKGRNENTGTMGELSQGKQLMAHYGFSRPELYTGGFNVGNAYYQATELLQLDASVPADLPRSFDYRSDQLWTKHRLLWAVLAYPRLRAIRAAGH